MLKSIDHVQKTRFITSTFHSVDEGTFVSKSEMKQQFLEGLNTASGCATRSYAQVVLQGVKKNVVNNKHVGWNMGTVNRGRKISNTGTHAGAHKVTMCNNSTYIE